MKRLILQTLFILPLILSLVSCRTENGLLSGTPITKASGWAIAGSDPKSYEMGIVKGAGLHGNNAASIKSIDKSINGFGTLMQSCTPGEYLGKRVRMSGFMKTIDVSGWAGFWFRIDPYLGFDNMKNGKKDISVQGTTEWKKYEIVLDVPEKTTDMAYGALLVGTGQIFFENIKFEIVDNSVEVTGMDWTQNSPLKEPANLNFELKNNPTPITEGLNIFKTESWFNAGSAPDSYKMGIVEGAGQAEKNAATIQSSDKAISGFGTLMQDCLPDKYIGKKVKMTGEMKSKDVKEWAGFWIRVDGGKQYSPTTFDNMQDRAIKGTTDWKKYEITLDVPEGATNIAYGALLDGTGQIWFENLTFEIIGTSTTPAFTADDKATEHKGPSSENLTAPTNLDFSK